LRKHQADAEMEDTVEHNAQGLAEIIIAEDEAKRAQDLVNDNFHYMFDAIQHTHVGPPQYRAKTAKLGS
jgi:hypothetical protein